MKIPNLRIQATQGIIARSWEIKFNDELREHILKIVVELGKRKQHVADCKIRIKSFFFFF